MTLIGGLGRFSGPVVGAFVLIALEHYFAEAGGWVTMIQGGVFVLFVLTFHQGIVGWLVGPEAMDTGFSLASVILSYFLVGGGMLTATVVGRQLQLSGVVAVAGVLAAGAFAGGFIAGRASRGRILREPVLGAIAVIGSRPHDPSSDGTRHPRVRLGENQATRSTASSSVSSGAAPTWVPQGDGPRPRVACQTARTSSTSASSS